jgi:hypothetical protein
MMLKTTRVLATLIFCALSSLSSADYTGITWGLDRTSSPYKIGINLSGIWYDFGQITSGGVVTPNATGLTANSVPFVGSTGILSEDNTNLWWDDTNNLLKIPTPAVTDRTAVAATMGALQNFAVPHVNATSYGVVTGNTTDQVANLNAALAAIPASGGVLDLPCGLIYIGSSWNVTTQNVTINGGGRFCTILYTDASYLTGNILTLAGNYSSVQNLGFYSGAQPSTIYRTGGIDLNMTGAYTRAEHLTFRGCYICITSNVAAGFAFIHDIDITRPTPATTTAGGAMLDIVGPRLQTIVSKFFAFGDSTNVDSPDYGIRIINSGQVNMDAINILGMNTALQIAPTAGKSAQVVQIVNSALDSSLNCDINVAPAGTGYVIDLKISNSYIETANTTSSGICMDGSASTATYPIYGVKIEGNTIEAAFGGNAALAANGISFDQYVTDLDIGANTIAGWNNIGVWAKTLAHDFTIHDNKIGSYNYFVTLGAGTTRNNNFIGLQFDAGATSGEIADNELAGNTTTVTNNSNGYLRFNSNSKYVPAVTFATLPTCNANTPDLWRIITDGAAAPVWNAAAAGGAAVYTRVECMNAAWVNR